MKADRLLAVRAAAKSGEKRLVRVQGEGCTPLLQLCRWFEMPPSAANEVFPPFSALVSLRNARLGVWVAFIMACPFTPLLQSAGLIRVSGPCLVTAGWLQAGCDYFRNRHTRQGLIRAGQPLCHGEADMVVRAPPATKTDHIRPKYKDPSSDQVAEKSTTDSLPKCGKAEKQPNGCGFIRIRTEDLSISAISSPICR